MPIPFYPGFGSTVYNVVLGVKRALPLPVYVVSPDSRFALCVDYSRLYITHETIGYVEENAPSQIPNAPANDGIHYMDIATGHSRLITSYADLRNFNPVKSMDKAIHWVSHIEINPSSSRFLMLHRWTERVKDETCFASADYRQFRRNRHASAGGFGPSAATTGREFRSECGRHLRLREVGVSNIAPHVVRHGSHHCLGTTLGASTITYTRTPKTARSK